MKKETDLKNQKTKFGTLVNMKNNNVIKILFELNEIFI
jgi:hypothetical protein